MLYSPGNKFKQYFVISIVLLVFAATAATVLGVIYFNMDTDDTFSDIEIEQFEISDNNLNKLRKDPAYLQKSIVEKTAAMMSAIKAEASAGRVNAKSIHLDKKNNIIYYEYNSGILACETLDRKFDRLSSGTINPHYRTGIQNNSKTVVFNSTDTKNKVADAIILNATTAHEERLWTKDWASNLAEKWGQSGVNTKIVYNVTLDDLSHLGGYEFILIEAHGELMDFTSYGLPHVMPFIKLEQEKSTAVTKAYSKDIKKHRILYPDGCYAVTASFIKEHNKGIKDSMLFMLSCSLLGNDKFLDKTWEKELTPGKGKNVVSSFVAFQYPVCSEYGWELLNVYSDCLINGKTSGEAYDAALAEVGSSQNVWMNSDRPKAYGIKYNCEQETFDWLEEHKNKPAKAYVFGNKKAKLKWEAFVGEETTVSETSKATKETPYEITVAETSTVKPNVVISTAVKKTLKGADEPNDYRIPKIEISGVNTDETNKKIMNACSKLSYKNYHMKYTYFVSAKYNVVSILVYMVNRDDPEWLIDVYNISTESGKLVSDNDLLKMYGISEKAFFDRVKSIYKVAAYPCKEVDTDDPEPVYKANLKRTSFKYVTPYLGPNDSLRFKGELASMSIDAPYLFDFKSGKEVDDNIPDPNPPLKREYKISYAVDKTVKSDDYLGGSYEYRIPKVSISGVNTDETNKIILETCSKHSYQKYHMDYSYHVNVKHEIISLLVKSNEAYSNDWHYDVFNVSVETGKLISNSEMLKLYSVTEKDFLDRVKTIYKKYGSFDTDKDPDSIIKSNMEFVSFEYITLYSGNDGDLCFKGTIVGDKETADNCFDWVESFWLR